ncbi:MAG: hypothetical protein V3S00_02885 [Dehalococcoidia bacterium]
MTQPDPTILIVETTDDEECPIDFMGDSADLVYFFSFAHSERYGADHPLAKAASVMKRQLSLNLAPLLTFADSRTENEEEERLLETLWQEAAPLAASARQAAVAIEERPQLRAITTEFPELPERLRELADMADWATARGAKVRLTYVI